MGGKWEKRERERSQKGGENRERRRKNLEAFESEVKVEVVAPFCVGDGTALNEAKKFNGLPTKIVLEIRMEV